MARTNSRKTDITEPELLPVSDSQEADPEDVDTVEESSELVEDVQDIDDILNSLKTLLSTIEKLQKIRQDVGDIKLLLVRMLDGELMAGEELEQLKTGVGGLLRLVRAHTDYQAALTKAQPARSLLDEVLKS
jgi:hypothetical protein